MGAGMAYIELARGGEQGSSDRPFAIRTRTERDLDPFRAHQRRFAMARRAWRGARTVDISYMNSTTGLFLIVKYIVFHE
jgi:hypothetical protein